MRQARVWRGPLIRTASWRPRSIVAVTIGRGRPPTTSAVTAATLIISRVTMTAPTRTFVFVSPDAGA